MALTGTLFSVSRLVCFSESYEMELLLDINTQLYPMGLNQRFYLQLARTLQEDGTPDDGLYDQSGVPSMADKFDYVMHGRVYKIDEDAARLYVEQMNLCPLASCLFFLQHFFPAPLLGPGPVACLLCAVG